MNTKVLIKDAVLEIDGIKYHHHPNGGGLIAETAEVAESVYIGLSIVLGPNVKLVGNIRVENDDVQISTLSNEFKSSIEEIAWNDVVRAILINLRITAYKLSRELGVTHPTISRWIRKESKPRPEAQNKIRAFCQANNILEKFWNT